MRVRLSKSAARYLRKETDYLKSRSPAAAIRFTERIRKAKRNLQMFPDMGSEERELPIAGARTWVAGDYLFDYIRVGDVIEIVAIRAGQMKPPTLDIDPDHDFEDEPQSTPSTAHKPG